MLDTGLKRHTVHFLCNCLILNQLTLFLSNGLRCLNTGKAMKMFIFLGAVFCFTGVLAGAVGAHALKDYLIKMEGLNRLNREP